MNHLNIDRAVICVKTIVDANRCFTCDQLNVSSIRYPCGHSVCKNCLLTQEYCLLCETPPYPCPHLLDESLNQRVLHASELITLFQDVFNVDVNRRPRISDKLKLEKLLFPKCIQAPIKYVNKRKSLSILDTRKISSSVSILPGENIYESCSKMDNKIEYVHQWLKNNDSNRKNVRKPLEDLNVNHSFIPNKPKNVLPHSIKKSSNRKKRKYAEKFVSDNIKQLSSKKYKKSIQLKTVHIKDNVNINIEEINLDQNESGIVIDDETLFIDNSQSECHDNDIFNSVIEQEAELNDETTTVVNNKNILPQNITSYIHKSTNKCAVNGCFHQVAFYRKSTLIETCQLCNEFNTCIIMKKKLNDVTITIDSKSFVTSINLSHCVQDKTRILKRKSVTVQTDMNDFNLNNNNISEKVMLTNINLNDVIHLNTENIDSNITNMDWPEKNNALNLVEKAQSSNESVSYPKCLVVEDSDVSDTDNDKCCDLQNTIEVSADVHRSCSSIDYEVLHTLHPHEYEHRNRHAAREHTPVSTDSSDKENYDPNRFRRIKNRDKKCDGKK